MHKGPQSGDGQQKWSGEADQANLADSRKLTGIKVQYETFTEDQVSPESAAGVGCGTGSVDVIHTATAQEGFEVLALRVYEPLDEYLKSPRLTDRDSIWPTSATGPCRQYL